MTTILEGTWEEIKSHDANLTGRNVRLIIEPDFSPANEEIAAEPNAVRDQAHLEELLLEGLNSGPMTPMTAEDWADIRREGRVLAAQGRSLSTVDA